MANTISSDLQLDLVLASAMEAFKEYLTPLALFSTVFNDVPLQGTDKVQVPYYPLETAASKTFNGSYVFDAGTNTQSKELTINTRKYQPLSFTSAELARNPRFDPERLGRLKGQKLAEDVLIDIWSLITASNYGSYAFAGAASDFDVDDTIDLEVAVTTAKWPVAGRGLILKPAYIGGLKKDMNANGGLATFGIGTNGSLETFPVVNTFNLAHSNVIPANSENLIGFASFPSALLVGFSPIQPAPEVMDQLSRYEVVSDPATGISLEYRQWGDADSDTAKRVIEVNYGKAVGEAAALKRLLSATP